jgi:hypothetical protein
LGQRYRCSSSSSSVTFLIGCASLIAAASRTTLQPQSQLLFREDLHGTESSSILVDQISGDVHLESFTRRMTAALVGVTQHWRKQHPEAVCMFGLGPRHVGYTLRDIITPSGCLPYCVCMSDCSDFYRVSASCRLFPRPHVQLHHRALTTLEATYSEQPSRPAPSSNRIITNGSCGQLSFLVRQFISLHTALAVPHSC